MAKDKNKVIFFNLSYSILIYWGQPRPRPPPKIPPHLVVVVVAGVVVVVVVVVVAQVKPSPTNPALHVQVTFP